MFSYNHYVPVLKWKRGEQKALESLSIEQKRSLTPIIEVVPIAYDFENKCNKKTINEHLNGIGDQIYSAWPLKQSLFLDLFWINDIDQMESGEHPLDYILNQTREYDIQTIPVTGTSRSSAYKQAVKRAIAHDSLGVCFRIVDDDFSNLKSSIASLLSEYSVSPSNVDIVIDLKYVSQDDYNRNVFSVQSVIGLLPNIKEWRTLTLCASSFPENLSAINANSVGVINRSEWMIWNALYKKRDELARVPSYGDYAIANPFYYEIDPRIMAMSANIRYTTDSSWIVYKGQSVKKHGFGQFKKLSRLLISNPAFLGSSFSVGDEYIALCARDETKEKGNAETWRRVATNHHLVFVINQIASHS